MTTDPSPKLPLWVFVASDIALLATAWLIAEYSQHPLSPAAVAAIASCAALGTLVLLVPLLLRYERLKNEVLDDRQRSLEGIARTVHESAEQLSIAANGLNQIASLTRQSLQTAEALPEKLKTQLAAFDSKTASVNDAERGRLEKELAALRKTNSDQLSNIATQIVQVTGEWTKLESAAREQLARAQETLGNLDRSAATQIAAAHAAALAELEVRIKALGERAMVVASATPAVATSTPPPPAAPAPAEPEPIAALPAVTEPAVQAISEPVVAVAPTETAAPVTTPAPKRPRKPRRETPAEPATATTPTAEAPSTIIPSEVTPVVPEPAPEAPAAPVTEVITAPTTEASPAEAPSAAVVDTVTAPSSAAVEAEPSPAPTPTPTPESSAPKEESPAPTEIAPPPPAPAPAPAESPRKRSARAKPEAAPEPMLDLVIDDSAPPARAMERGLSSDGATRMIVTAYIGIGNRLFIRGEGPGLSPDKGVPLQFISIGKWLWETNDATAPIRFRILKNDSVECSGLGEQTLEPGYQAEFGANF